MERNLQHLGEYTGINQIIEEKGIEEVIIAIETKEHGKLERILNILKAHPHLRVHVIPDTYDILSGQVRLQSYGAPLVEIKHELMPVWQKVSKRVFDLLFSSLVLILLSPVLLFCAVMVKMSSSGPIFFRQERIGLNGKKFNIIKFRSMVANAEQDGPQLSSENDDRITSWGRVMRKYRLDELPQFLNVLTGDMAIVGPRPERSFYIDQIVEEAPHYVHLHKVRPGITSWGMVKFGYAENVTEMVQRLKYDVIYIENMNLMNDLKILIYTVLIVLQGRGK
jgi:exopolysaccharide biosynthesis polyprenyl glycosylphosphotransferase